jgi:hypothetical protein
MSQFLKYITKKMRGGGDIGSLPGVLSLSAIQQKIKLEKDIKNQKARNAQATISQYIPKPGDQQRMNRAKDAYRADLAKPLNRAAESQLAANAWSNIVKPMLEMEGIASGVSGVRSMLAKPKRIPTSFYSDPVITRGPIPNPWDGKGIRVEMEGSLDVPEGMMPYIGREEWVPTTPAEKVWASFFNGKARPIPPPYKKQKGGAYVDSVFNAPNNKQLEWVQRLYQKNGKSIMVPGQTEPSTHYMESGDGRVYPTVVTMPDGSLKYLGKGAYDYADSTKTYIKFPTDNQAKWFGKNYKKGTGVLAKKKGGPIVDPRGQWAHPGKVTRIPGSDITMQGVPYPVLGVGSNGQQQMMYPGENYDFGGAAYVDEYPMMQFGGGTLLGPSGMIMSLASKVANYFSKPKSSGTNKRMTTYGQMNDSYANRNKTFYDKWQANDAIKYDSSVNPINLTSGRFRGAKVAPGMINDIVNAAKTNNVDPWLMLSLVGRESTFGADKEYIDHREGNKQDLISGWNVAEDYQPYEVNRYLADKKVPGIKVIKNSDGWSYEVEDEQAIESYLKSNPKLIDDYYKKLASTPDLGKLDSFSLAAQRIKKKGVKNYNPGDPRYSSMVNEDMNLLKNDAALKAYMKTLGYRQGGEFGGVVKMQRGGRSMFDPIFKEDPKLNKNRGDIASYFPQIQRMKDEPKIKEAIVKADQKRQQQILAEAVAIGNKNRTTVKQDNRTSREKEIAQQQVVNAYLNEAKGKSPFAQTLSSFTPTGYNPEASKIAAENIGQMTPMMGATRLFNTVRDPENNPYGIGQGNGFLANTLGTIGLLGDVFDVGAVAAPGVKAAGNYLTQQTPLRNAHKLNPYALTDDMLFNKEGVVNRQMFGDDAYNSFLKFGPTTRPGVPEMDKFMEFIKAPRSQIRSANDEVFEVVNTMEDGVFKYPYFQEGSLWYTGQQRNNLAKELGKERIITTPKSDIWFAPAGEATLMGGDDLVSKGLIDRYSKGRRVLIPGTEYAKPSKYSVFEPHWWKGYKQLQKDGGQILNDYDIMQLGGQSAKKSPYFFMNLNDDFTTMLKNRDYVKSEYNKGMDFHTKWLNSPMYKSMINASDPVNAKNITDQRKDRLSAVTMKYVDDPYNKAGASADQLGNIEVYPEGIGAKGIGVHEISHVTDTGPGQNLIPTKDRIDISRYSLASENIPKYNAYKEYFNYVTRPSETRARLNEIRQGASENKLYDPFTEKVSPAIYNKLKNFKFNSTPGSDPLQQLRSAYSDEQILQMLNSVSKLSTNKNNDMQNMMNDGGEMIRRADGTYSRRGLWDNIRANKGSGKKPTNEMLEQERKIKAKEMKYGGGTNNPGFEALPDYVQAKILSNMGYGGMTYPFMQKGGEPDGSMALGQIDAAMDKLQKLRQFIQPDSDLEPWISSKLTMMDDYADAVSDYMMYNPDAELDELDQMRNGGYVVTRSDDRKGKTHKVTGPDGTVKYFGDSKLGQHPGDPERKEAFYARHKKNLDGNPYFRAFARETWADGGALEYGMGGMPCYECGGAMYKEGGMYDCPDQEKDPVTGKCKAEVVRGREANAANKAANADMNAWAKQVAAMDKEVAKQNAAQYAGQRSFDYDWMQSPVDKAEKKAAIAQYKQFIQQNPNVFVADDSSGVSPEQKYIIASKLKQKSSTPMGSKAFQQKFNQDARLLDLGRIQSDIVPLMGGWSGIQNWLFGNKKFGGYIGQDGKRHMSKTPTWSGNAGYKQGGPVIGEEMEVTPEQLEQLRAQGYEFEII